MRAKRSRFNHNKTANNIIQEGKAHFDLIKGQWQRLYFENDNPVCLELACGYGEYTTGMAELFPHKNFVGIDIKGDRLWQGSTIATENGLENAAFLRALIHDLDKYFAKNEVSEIWLTFPDPRPKNKDRRRRLTSNRFIEMYKQLLAPDGWFKLKTDDTELFEFTLSELNLRKDIKKLEYTVDLSASKLLDDHFGITTRFEEHFSKKGEDIKYLKFKFEKDADF
jgi:tRNA (guanine-N7-)-methyltransferase